MDSQSFPAEPEQTGSENTSPGIHQCHQPPRRWARRAHAIIYAASSCFRAKPGRGGMDGRTRLDWSPVEQMMGLRFKNRGGKTQSDNRAD